jgi:hypothetical protein
MKLRVALIFVASLIMTADVLVSARASQRRKSEPKRYVYERTARPGSEIEYPRAVKFKLGSRKSTYRRGEIITLDLAMLNVSGRNLFLHKMVMPNVSLRVRSDGANAARISTYLLVLEAVVPGSYEYVGKDQLISGSLQILVDCSLREKTRDRSLQHLQETQANNSAQDKAVFENDLFVSWGDACLSLPGPGHYTITAEMTNEFVIVSAEEPRAKTAVGTIESAPLTIVIEE